MTASIHHYWAAPRTSDPHRKDVLLALHVQGGDCPARIFFIVASFSLECALLVFHIPQTAMVMAHTSCNEPPASNRTTIETVCLVYQSQFPPSHDMYY